MSVKVIKVKAPDPKSATPRNYPLIATSIATGVVVLFSAKNCGTVIGYIGTARARQWYPIGYHSDQWADLEGESVTGNFRPWEPGTEITLVQE